MSTSTLVSDQSKPALNGTSGPDILRGTEASEIINSGLGDDRIYANGGDDILIGSLGRDALDGGSGTNTFLYSHLTESYYAGNATDHADLIRNFDTSNNLIDVSALGFYGLGNGHADTLLIAVNDAGTRTYVKSYGYDEGGDRFEIAFDGNVSQYLTADHFIFTPTHITGSAGADFISGTEADEILEGVGGGDHIFGRGGDDTIIGGAGRDTLEGGQGANTFVFTAVNDSYRDASVDYADIIRDFTKSEGNQVDVSALGFTSLGDGHGSTLTIAVNDAGTRTYLKSYEVNEDGNRFEVAFDGDITQYLTEDRIVFAGTRLDTVSIADDQVQPSETVNIEPLGVLPESTSGAA
jgi:Ca2+-binding RTX toxin-like protein